MNTIVNAATKVVQRYLPDAFVLAIMLTAIVAGSALSFTSSTPVDVVLAWGDGFSNLFTFAMQMALVLLTGFVLALSPPVGRLLDWLTNIPNRPSQALAMTAAISFVGCYLNWGLGLVVGAIVARAMGRKVRGLHFPLVVAAAYSAEVVRGPSSSIPLVMATPDHFMYERTGVISVTETLYSWWNILITLMILAAIIILYSAIRVPKENVVEFSGHEEEEMYEARQDVAKRPSFGERLDNSRLLLIVLALLPVAYIVLYFIENGFNLDLNIIILIFLSLALLTHRSVAELLVAVEEAIKSTRGIILQFPFYAGVSGIMSETGLVEVFSEWFISLANANTFPIVTFLSAGIINIFIPSGGGQWAIQGPVMLQAAESIGADIPQTIMAFAWGDGWTNQVQPFWALPLLGVAGLKARDIMGYCIIWLLITGIIIAGTFTLITFI